MLCVSVATVISDLEIVDSLRKSLNHFIPSWFLDTPVCNLTGVECRTSKVVSQSTLNFALRASFS